MTPDGGLILAEQKAEHYEIATFRCLITLANTLGLREIAKTLRSMIREEKATDEKLTQITDRRANVGASQEE